MTGGGFEVGDLNAPGERWSDLAEQIARTAAGLAATGSGGLPPRAQAAASAFTAAWARHAQESATMAEEFSQRLWATRLRYTSSDESSASSFTGSLAHPSATTTGDAATDGTTPTPSQSRLTQRLGGPTPTSGNGADRTAGGGESR